jgi:protein TorT
MAYYFTPPVYEGIKAGTILAAPTDSAVIQGRVAIDQVVRLLEGKEIYKRVSPQIYVIDKSNIGSFDYNSSLAPPDFKPTFSVD